MELPDNVSNGLLTMKILILAIPIILYGVITTLNMTVLYSFSRKTSADETEAISMFTSFFNLFVYVCINNLNIGFQILGSNAFGSRKFKVLGLYLNTIVVVFTILAFVLALLSDTVVPLVYDSVTSNSAMHFFNQLIRISSLGLPQVTILITLMNYTNIIQRNHIAIFFLCLGFVLQVLFSLFLVDWLRVREIVGVAVSLVLNCSVGLVFLFYVYYFKPHPESVIPLNLRKCFQIWWKVVKFSLLPFINEMLFFLLVYLNSFISLLKGKFSFTAFNIVMNLTLLNLNILDGIACANGVLCAYFIGKGNKRKTLTTFTISLILAGILDFAFLLVVNLCSESIIEIYSENAIIYELISNNFHLIISLLSTYGFNAFLTEFIIVCGNQYLPLFNSLFSGVLMLAVSFCLVEQMGNFGIFMSSILANCLNLVVSIIYLIFYLDIDGEILSSSHRLEQADEIQEHDPDESERRDLSLESAKENNSHMNSKFYDFNDEESTKIII